MHEESFFQNITMSTDHALVIGSNIGSLLLSQRLLDSSLNVCIGLHNNVTLIPDSHLSSFTLQVDPYYSPDLRNRLHNSFLVPGSHDLFLRTYSYNFQYSNSSFVLEPHLYDLIHSKVLFRNHSHSYLPENTPQFFTSYDSFLKAGLDPSSFLLKPEHAGGGRGIHVLSSDYVCSLNSPYLIERIVQGFDVSISMFLSNSSIHYLYSDLEFSSEHYSIEGSASSQAFISSVNSSCIPATLLRLATSLGISDGLIHSQIRISQDSWYIIEMTQRLPGDAYQIVPMVFLGVDYESYYLSQYIPKN